MKYLLLPVLIFIIPTGAFSSDAGVADNIKPVSTTSAQINQPGYESMLAGVQQLMAEEDYRAAVAELKELSKSYASQPEVWRLLGLAAHKKGDYLRSKTAFEKALSLAPADITTLGLQADLFLSMGDKNSARSNLGILDVLCPDGCESRERIASALGLY